MADNTKLYEVKVERDKDGRVLFYTVASKSDDKVHIQQIINDFRPSMIGIVESFKVIEVAEVNPNLEGVIKINDTDRTKFLLETQNNYRLEKQNSPKPKT